MSTVDKYKNLLQVEDRGSQGEVSTPITLVNEMLDKLPEEVFKSDTTTFLDPSFGSGTFLIEIVKRLRKEGHSMENIQERIYGTEISHRLYNKVTKLFSNYNFRKLYKEDFLTKDFSNMKYDVVIGNPPFNAPGSKPGANHLWPQFVKMSCEISGRYILLVTPKKWTGFSTNIKKGKVSLYRDYFKGNLKFANIGECSKYFTVGNSKDSFSYYLIDTNGVDKSEVVTSTGTVTFASDKLEYMPTEIFGNESFSIFDKFFNSRFPKYKFLSKYYIEKTNTNKLIINSAQRQFINKIDIFLDNNTDENLKPTTKCYQTKEELPDNSTDVSVNSILRSKLYTFIHKSYFDGDCFTVGHWDRVPIVDSTKEWSNEELYKLFNLTKEEIDLIESTVS
jgi:hypothetical protein